MKKFLEVKPKYRTDTINGGSYVDIDFKNGGWFGTVRESKADAEKLVTLWNNNEKVSWDEVIDALKFYADESNYELDYTPETGTTSNIIKEGGITARAILSRLEVKE